MVNIRKTRKFLESSYHPKPQIGNNILDKSLSGKRVKVYYNPNTKKSIVVHRGTASLTDWVKTDIPAAFGYEKGNRFRHGAKIQKQAEAKYGSQNVTTMGHSLGGRIAEKVGKNSKEIITYNKYATPKSIFKTTPSNQTDIRVKNDAASYLSNYQKKRGVTVTLPTTSFNPITAHSLATLKNSGF